MSSKKKLILAAATAAILPATSALAAPLVNLRLLGRNVTLGETAFTSSVTAGTGDTIELQLAVGLNDVGSVNIQGATTRTITSKTNGTDGINSLKFNVYDPTGDGVDSNLGAAAPFTLTAPWLAASGTGGGAIQGPSTGSSGGIYSVRPAQASGTFVGANADNVIGTASITLVSAVSNGLIKLGVNQPININGASALGAKINGVTTIAGTTATENTTDPMIGLNHLNIVVPEPASLGLLGLAGLALVRRRRS